jgi:hypothetical protein
MDVVDGFLPLVVVAHPAIEPRSLLDWPVPSDPLTDPPGAAAFYRAPHAQ